MAVSPFPGLSLRGMVASGGPIPWGFLPLNEGVTVLYGLNGAGKSFALDALHACLTGRVPERLIGLQAGLLITFDEDGLEELPGPDDDDWDEVSGWGEFRVDDRLIPILEALAPSESAGRLMDGAIDWSIRRRVRDLVRAAFQVTGRTEIEGLDLDALANEVAAQGSFLLTPTGATASGWRLEVIAHPIEGFPQICQIARAIAEDPRSRPDDTEDNFLLEGYAVGRRARHFTHKYPLVDAWMLVPKGIVGDPSRPSFFAVNGLSFEVESLSIPTLGPQLPSADTATRSYLGTRLAELGSHSQKTEAAGAEYEEAVRISGELCARANALMAEVLLDAPVLELRVQPLSAWVTGTPTEWLARRSSTERAVPLTYLSEAQERWSRFAIALATSEAQHPVVLLDEPEAALHRSAEKNMAKAIAALARAHSACLVCATHSPDLLDMPTARPMIVRRRDQLPHPGGSIDELGDPSRRDLEQLGLLPSDLLRRQRGFLIVEGEHDLAVLEETIGDELRALRIELLPLRGAGQLKSLVDSRVLYDYTDAHLFIMLDALDAAAVQLAWQAAQSQAKTHTIEAAIDGLRSAIQDREIPESGMLASFLARALELDLGRRVTPTPLLRLDILDYLPVHAFVPGAASWSDLRKEQQEVLGRPPSGREFKEWLRQVRGADLSTPHIRSVAAGVPQAPAEFQRHLDVMSAVLLSG